MSAQSCQLPSPLSVGGDFTIERASELRQLLLEQIASSAPQSLCLKSIGEIDCSGLQLLLALKRQQPDLRLCNPSPAVSQLFQRLRLDALLEH